MLVLGRKEGESIRIGENVVIYVTNVSGKRVQLAIDAPPEIEIQRGELNLLSSDRIPAVRGDPANSSATILGENSYSTR